MWGFKVFDKFMALPLRSCFSRCFRGKWELGAYKHPRRGEEVSMLKLEWGQAAKCCSTFLAKSKGRMKKKRKFYAVAQGQQPGIYDTWEACKRQVDGYRGSRYKSFSLREEAERYLVESSVPISVPSNSKSQQPTEELGQARQNVVKDGQRSKGNGRTSKVVIRKQAKDSNKQLLNPTAAHLQLQDAQKSLLSTENCSSFPNQSMTFASQSELEEYLGISPITSISHFAANIKQNKSEGAKVIHRIDLNTLSSLSFFEEVYQLEYDGASKGNPGLAGAGALLRHPDGSVVCELTEGIGIATNNVAEYSALILGLREALRRGIKRIKVQGDSLLVCQQVLGNWAIKSQNLKSLWEEAKRLTEQFTDFTIRHVDREYNSDADALANRAVELSNKS